MLYKYTIINQEGVEQSGTIDAVSEDTAIGTLQRDGHIITNIEAADKKPALLGNITFFDRVSQKELVILSRQISTLFHASVSALRVFRMLGSESENPIIQRVLTQVADDIQAGATISGALAKHPQVFSSFYCNMVLTGEESGRLEEQFEYLAKYLERNYEITSRAQHALVYPAFVITTFVVVMILMLTMVIPNLMNMIKESGVEVPFYTRVVMMMSDLFRSYGVLLFGVLAIGVIVVVRFYRTPAGRVYFDQLKISTPFVGNLYRKLYLTRIADTLSTMLASGIGMVRTLEIAAGVVENIGYERALTQARDDIKNGAAISKAFSVHPEIPSIMVQMIRVGEETGELGTILDTLSRFYTREVNQAVDALVGLIEPLMIIMLAGGVGTLIASVLMPIYSITMSIK